MKGENGKVYDILTWAGSIGDQEGRWPRKATSIALGRGVYLASPTEESARHNLWQRRLAFARPPHQNKTKQITQFVCLWSRCNQIKLDSSFVTDLVSFLTTGVFFQQITTSSRAEERVFVHILSFDYHQFESRGAAAKLRWGV
jgi:hypothetical protein